MIQLRTSLGLIAIAYAATVGLESGHSQEWSRFRGPNGSGVGEATGLPSRFSMADYEWMVDLNGSGHSSPVLWGEKIFLTVLSSKKDSHSRQVVCVNAKNGKVQWSEGDSFREHHKHDFNSFASSTPVVDSERVYVVWASGEATHAMARDHRGKLIWNRKWEDFSSDHGSAASPILVEGALILHTDSKDKRQSLITALNPADGEVLWEKVRLTPESDEKHLTSYSTPTTIKMGGKTVVVFLSTNHGWLGLDPKTGEVALEYDDDEYKFRSVGSLVSSGDLVFGTMGSGSAGKQSAALVAKSGSVAPEVRYTLGIKDGLSYVPTPIIHNGLLYLWGDGGVLTCREVKTGKEIYKNRVGPGQFFSSPILADGKIYCGSRDGRMFVVKAGRNFKMLAENRLGSGVHATPAIANNRMYIRTDSHLICLPRR